MHKELQPWTRFCLFWKPYTQQLENNSSTQYCHAMGGRNDSCDA